MRHTNTCDASAFLTPADPRTEDKVLAEDPITSFALIFRPKFWWFEIYNM